MTKLNSADDRIRAAELSEELPEIQEPTLPEEVVSAVSASLAPRPSTEIATYNAGQELDASDVLLPWIKVGQAMSQACQRDEDPVKQGNFYITLGDVDLGSSIRIVPLGVQKTRAYFEREGGLLCRSNDFVVGIGDPGGECVKCPLQEWNPGGVKGAPKCRVGYVYPVVVFPEGQEPSVAMLRLTGTSTGAAKVINGKKSTSPAPWWTQQHQLTTKKETNQRGQSYHVVQCRVIPEPLTEEDREIVASYVGFGNSHVQSTLNSTDE